MRPGRPAPAPTLAERRSAFTPTTTATQRAVPAEQLELPLHGIFVHRHQKAALYGVDVSRRLTLLRRQAAGMSDEAFHNEMCDVVNDLREGHTDYVRPGCATGAWRSSRPPSSSSGAGSTRSSGGPGWPPTPTPRPGQVRR